MQLTDRVTSTWVDSDRDVWTLQRRVSDLEMKLDGYLHAEEMRRLRERRRRAEATSNLLLGVMVGVNVLFGAAVWIAILLKAA
ncbi:MAG: hypothetical protein OEZ42_14235 [Gemmatimonadota bacterium]|nr:hypothetical protein [Gemmatimonadota bacterium]MDH5551050.1 hypothetical protein [Gemmatimonadota bacterium]